MGMGFSTVKKGVTGRWFLDSDWDTNDAALHPTATEEGPSSQSTPLHLHQPVPPVRHQPGGCPGWLPQRRSQGLARGLRQLPLLLEGESFGSRPPAYLRGADKLAGIKGPTPRCILGP
jgi:hypothetical protein